MSREMQRPLTPTPAAGGTDGEPKSLPPHEPRMSGRWVLIIMFLAVVVFFVGLVIWELFMRRR